MAYLEGIIGSSHMEAHDVPDRGHAEARGGRGSSLVLTLALRLGSLLHDGQVIFFGSKVILRPANARREARDLEYLLGPGQRVSPVEVEPLRLLLVAGASPWFIHAKHPRPGSTPSLRLGSGRHAYASTAHLTGVYRRTTSRLAKLTNGGEKG